ncbi:ABC-F family ATP-binding cassette domain-containing protein [Phenylobacterium sp.]|uniref:ABC-F family ATP-binding cassette domain-containing protein n=1 Tax=Phenylobacterium sp. TaxID=1871053 RepID=UPI00281134BC|nr:ABC-F family ATP-binding cassette domain-containing protein [Phenylobacterium sp.]
MLQINDLVFDAWGRRFFDHASVTLPKDAKVGLVGRNGVGKSTLFKLILNELTLGSGEISLPKAARIGSVAQEHPATPIPLLETVLAADVERASLLAQLDTAPPEEMGEIYNRLIQIDADRAPSRAAEILSGLGFSEADLSRPMAEFSGGWRMRVALAASLFAEPDLLLLDEPTNYLDLEGALWLEARLRKYPHTAIVISHDRELLNSSVDHILHLKDGKLELYVGGYDSFERQWAEKLRLQEAARAKIEAKRAHMQSFVDRFRAKATKARQAQSRLKAIAKLPPVAAVIEDHVAPFLLPSPERPLPPPLLRLEDVAVGYGGPPILRKLNLRLDIDDRIGLLGVNGAGKSTFAKLVAGALTPESGAFHRSQRMKVGWFHQHQIEAMDPNDTPLEIIRRALPDATEARRRAVIAAFGFSYDKVETKVASLSGGERARLLLNLVAMEAPHLLILDEPTNHLDIDSRRALLDALNDYEGAVILITHDRSLMELVADRLWLAADGGIEPFDGDMEDYARFVLDRARIAARAPSQVKAEAPPAPPPPPAAPAKAKVPTGPARRRAEAAEAALARATAELARIDQALTDPAIFTKDPGKAAELGRRREAAQNAVEAAELEWLEAQEAYEALKA